MLETLIIFVIVVLLMIFSIIFFPKIKIKSIEIESYWVIVLFGAILMLVLGLIPIDELINRLFENNSVNPLKILTLFISMSVLSVFLDELGFFKYLAVFAIKKAKNNQKAIFIFLYLITSFLTIFTSNDIIILTLTPFICYFCKNAKINPIPYLISEFVSANTWSMMLIIGNPTNIYLGSMSNITFFEYLKVMALPTISGGFVSFLIVFVIFNKSLRKEMSVDNIDCKLPNKFLLVIGLCHLACCTVLLAISSYINLQMWIITLGFAISLLLITFIYSLIKKSNSATRIIKNTIKRAPWTLIPFILSMFVLVLSLKTANIPGIMNELIGNANVVFKYGILSMFFSNFMNNIPMCVFFSNCIPFTGASYIGATYASIIGSNIGAFLTPIGALAGIMFMHIARNNGVKLSFSRFIEYGVVIAIPTIVVSLSILLFEL